jgi:shikimate dehydrogenase
MINAHTEVYAILGHPVRHSFSPAIHNAAFQANNINAVYVAFDVENIADALKGIRALGIRGASITIPHKIAIIPYLDELTDLASKIGSVNTVYWEDGKLKGDNTDAYGFYESLSHHEEITDKTILMLGAGGAALAVSFALFAYDKPAKLIIAARNREQREQLRSRLLSNFPDATIETCNFESLSEARKQSQIIINTTPVGMFPNEDQIPFDPALIPEKITVMDLIYHPVETRLLQEAARKHCTIIPGTEMLLYQAARQFEIWTGEKPPLPIMKKALLSCLKQN